MKRDKVRVLDNGHGAPLYIVDNGGGRVYGVVKIEQKELRVENKRLKITSRTGEIAGKLDDMLEIAYESKQCLEGNIVIKEAQQAPVPEDEELFLDWEEDKVRRIGGVPVWRWSYYTEDPMDKDELIEETSSSTHP